MIRDLANIPVLCTDDCSYWTVLEESAAAAQNNRSLISFIRVPYLLS